MGRRRDGYYTLQNNNNNNNNNNNSVEDSVGNEENGYPVLDPNKTMINVTKEPSETPQKNPQRGNLGRNH
jgi:hypothetical protein